MANPRLRVRTSSFGGSGYVRPALGNEPFQIVKNADSEPIKAALAPNGKALRYVGITTALRQLDKPAIPQWKADSVSARAVANIDALLSRTQEEGFTYLRFAADETLNDAAEQGNFIHSWCQADLGVGGFYPEIENENHEQMIEAWETFKFSHSISNVRWAERTMANLDREYFGTADLLADIDDYEDCLIDLKSARSTWPDHWAQLAALTECTTEYYEIGGEGTNEWAEERIGRPKSAALIHIRPNDWDTKGNFIPAFAQLLPMNPRKHDVYFKLFLAALDASKARYELKELEKALNLEQ